MATLRVTDRMGDLGEYLKEQREIARLSLRQLASVAGVSNPYLSQIERGLRKPSAEVLQQIAKGLQISAEALFMRAGLLEESTGVEVEVAIQSDLTLTARQKRVLLDIYATFRAENTRETTPVAEVPVEKPARRARVNRTAAAADADTARLRAPRPAKSTSRTAKGTPRPTKGADRPARVKRAGPATR